MPVLDLNLAKLFLGQFLVTHFENPSTVIRKQVVLSLAELKYAMSIRLQTQCQLHETSFELLTLDKLTTGR